MADRYIGNIKCPYCKKETDFLYADDWGEMQICEHCGNKFKMYTQFKTKKLNKKER